MRIRYVRFACCHTLAVLETLVWFLSADIALAWLAYIEVLLMTQSLIILKGLVYVLSDKFVFLGSPLEVRGSLQAGDPR